MLQFQLYSRARDIVKKISDATIQSDHGADDLVNAVYKPDALAVINSSSVLSTPKEEATSLLSI